MTFAGGVSGLATWRIVQENRKTQCLRQLKRFSCRSALHFLRVSKYQRKSCRTSGQFPGRERLAKICILEYKPGMPNLSCFSFFGVRLYSRRDRSPPIIPASNEPSGKTCLHIWRVPRGSNPDSLLRGI